MKDLKNIAFFVRARMPSDRGLNSYIKKQNLQEVLQAAINNVVPTRPDNLIELLVRNGLSR
jgi:hypothetical protein